MQPKRSMFRQLSRYDQAFAAAEVSRGPFRADSVPDGEYDAVVERCELTEAQSSGAPMLVWHLRIRTGDFAGRTVKKHRVINERTVAWIKEDLAKCGLDLEKLSEVAERLEELEAAVVRIVKKTKDGNANLYFQWPSAESSEFGGDRDLPF
jgi:hypothetical protein